MTMANLKLFALLMTIFASSTDSQSVSPLEFGMEMSVRSYDAVCWYESLKKFPETDSKAYNKCSGKAKYQQNQIQTQDFFKKYPDKKEEYFGKWTNDKVIGQLPPPYKKACSKYLSDSKAEPPADEGEALNDGEKGEAYPYRAYAYCLLNTLRKERGDEAIEAVKTEKTVSRKNWMQAILDRDNEFRARHSVESFQLVKDLNTAAQTWADKMALECNMYHSKNEDPGRQWRGNGTGESLWAGGGEDDKEIAAYQASDGWYEEIRDYPYDLGGYDGKDKQLFEKIGHFTQSVWKGSKYVGYGYAFNDKCKDKGAYTRYIAARYSPAGNMPGKYPENVNPPKED